MKDTLKHHVIPAAPGWWAIYESPTDGTIPPECWPVTAWVISFDYDISNRRRHRILGVDEPKVDGYGIIACGDLLPADEMGPRVDFVRYVYEPSWTSGEGVKP